MTKKKVGILTFHAAHNYGSMLQTYALQRFVESKGYEVTILNLRPCAQRFMYIHPLQYVTRRRMKGLLFHTKLAVQNIKKWYLFEKFMRSEMNLSPEFIHISQLEHYIQSNDFHAVITGGDQIWNVDAQDFSIAYLLPFSFNKTRKIAYSPSFGNCEEWKPKDCEILLKSLLHDYDSLSVRDESGCEYLSDLLEEKVRCVADPAFLLSKEDYDELAGNTPLINRDYMLYYSPNPDSEIEEIAINYAHKHNIDIINTTGEYYDGKGMTHRNNIGPKEFLNLLKHAKVVCGKSFHLIVFCLILQKQFIAVSGHSDARQISILQKVNLLNHAIEKGDDAANFTLCDIDWNEVNSLLCKYIKDSDEYLTNSLSV